MNDWCSTKVFYVSNNWMIWSACQLRGIVVCNLATQVFLKVNLGESGIK